MAGHGTTGCIGIDGDRLWSRLMRMAGIGGTPDGGVNRQALSDEEHAAWAQMLAWGTVLGLEPATDHAANLFLTLPGADRSLAPVLVGSHLDSQPTGGRFDGVYGVLAALEAVSAMVEAGHTPPRDVVVVAWMNEEGSRFAPGMMGSAVFAGARAIDAVRACTDVAGVACGTEIDRIHAAFAQLPLRPAFVPSAYVELHIEQGRELEALGCPIGVVDGIQGKITAEVTLTGARGHAGTEPMASRRDAVMAFARVAVALQAAIALDDPAIRFTIGRVVVQPNAPSVISGEVTFRIDLRHPQNDRLRAAAEAMPGIIHAQASPCDADFRVLLHDPSVAFDEGLRRRIADAARMRAHSSHVMLSAAGHDAKHLAAICPSAMIFIPCRDGISHDPTESIERAHATAGAEVMLDVLITMEEH